MLDKLEHYGVRDVHIYLIGHIYLIECNLQQLNSGMLPIIIGVPQSSVLGAFLLISRFTCPEKAVLFLLTQEKRAINQLKAFISALVSQKKKNRLKNQ